MRNCFVYQCDRLHKDSPKRAMFIAPKDPEKFEQWRQALPKHRMLKTHDRVCEKHFKPSDIMRDWTYNIQGKTKKLMRSKPFLRPDAVPCIVPDMTKKTFAKRRKDASPIILKSPDVVQVDESPIKPECLESPMESTETLTQETEADADADVSQKNDIFEELHDNIFEVELPSTLWGVHREPDRKFVAFSRYEWGQGEERVAKSTSLMIDFSLRGRAWCAGKLVLDKDLYRNLAPPPNEENKSFQFHTVVKLLDGLEKSISNDGQFNVEDVKKYLESSLRPDPTTEGV